MKELQKQMSEIPPSHNNHLNSPRQMVSLDRSAISLHQAASDNSYIHPSGTNIDNSSNTGNNIISPNRKQTRKSIILPAPIKEQIKYKRALQINTFDYGIRFQLKRLFCFLGGAKNEQYKTYFALNNYLTERMDLRYYLHSLQKNDRMRTVLFNYYQNLSLDFMKSPNVCSAAELEEMDLMLNRNTDEAFNELIYYFKERKSNGTMDSRDNQLFEMVRQDVKDYVNENSKN
jgi:hypothetical protein